MSCRGVVDWLKIKDAKDGTTKAAEAMKMLDSTQLAFVSVLVIALEEDALPKHAADAAKAAMMSKLGPLLNGVLQSKLTVVLSKVKEKALKGDNLSNDQLTKLVMDELLPEVENIKAQLMAAAKEAAISSIIGQSNPFKKLGEALAAKIDPDNQLGTANSFHTIELGTIKFPKFIFLNYGLYAPPPDPPPPVWLSPSYYSLKGYIKVEAWHKQVPY